MRGTHKFKSAYKISTILGMFDDGVPSVDS